MSHVLVEVITDQLITKSTLTHTSSLPSGSIALAVAVYAPCKYMYRGHDPHK